MVSITYFFPFLIPLAFAIILVLAFRKTLKKFFINQKATVERILMKMKEIDQRLSDTNESDSGFFGKSIEFFNHNTNLLAIIASVCTIISLAPLFLGFLLGDNWSSNILAIPLGFDALMLIITATYFGATFSLILLILFIIGYCYSSFKDHNIPDHEKVTTFIIILIGGISIFCLNLFLVLVWFTKYDYIISNFGIPIFMTIFSILILVAAIGILGYIIEKAPNRQGKMIILFLTVFFIIALILTFFPVVDYFGVYYNERTKYYLPKTINSSINCNVSEKVGKYPIFLSITPNLSELMPTTSISDFDVYYAQCRWSTNYGFFYTTDYNNSVIKNRGQEFVISQCYKFNEKIYWTYDNLDYSKEKPSVYIGLSVDDPNKIKDYHLSNALCVVSWTDNNSLENVSSTSWASRIPQH